MSDWLDRLDPQSYSFKARVRPVLFVSVPLALGVWTWTQAPLDLSSWFISLALAAGIPYIAGEAAGDAGRARQAELWQSWGGAPATQFLRHRDGTLNSLTHARLHQQLQDLFPDLTIPTSAGESRDSVVADEVYDSCIDRLRIRYREQPLVLKANIAYGFRRNLWAIRRWGLACAGGATLLAVGHIYLKGPTTPAIVTIVASVGITLFLALVVQPDWVRRPAEIYGRRLLECLELDSSK